MDRQDAYKLVQRHAMAARDGAVSFRESLARDPNVTSRLSEAELAALFEPEQQLTEVDRIFERLGLPAAVHVHNHYEEAVPA
jgi:adenylosuccinate lyase